MSKTPKQRYGSWYANRGADRNERRREAYASDPELREANRLRAKEWRANRAKGAAVEREVFREVNGKRVRVYSLGQIADEVGYAASTLRLLVSSGELPEPKLGGTHRYYTAAEVRTIKAKLSKRSA